MVTKHKLNVKVKLRNSYEAFNCFLKAVEQIVDCDFIHFKSMVVDENANMILTLVMCDVREFPVENPEVNGRYFEFYLPDGRFYNSLKIMPVSDNPGFEMEFKLRDDWCNL